MFLGAKAGIKRRNESSFEEKKAKKVRIRKDELAPHDSNLGLRVESAVGFENLHTHYDRIYKLWNPMHGFANLEPEQRTALIELCRCFSTLLSSGRLRNNMELSKSDLLIVKWLNKRLEDLYALLLRQISSVQNFVCHLALDLSMQLLRAEISSRSSGDVSSWDIGIFPRLLQTLLHMKPGHGEIEHFTKGFFLPYADVTRNTLRYLKLLHNSEWEGLLLNNILSLLLQLDFRNTKEVISENFFCTAPPRPDRNTFAKKCQNLAEETWMNILKRPLSGAQRQQVLGLTSNNLVYWFSRPEILMDFLSSSFDAGGAESLTALPGIFCLMHEKNLDYPHFYTKLYGLLDHDYLHSKHQIQLLKLLDTFLSSTHLPAILVASFIKRLARLCLHAPPSGLIALIPWMYNLLKVHPACTLMIQRYTGASLRSNEQLSQTDPFLAREPDPMKTNAIESSLWEIETLQSHFHPNVSIIAKVVSEQFTKQAYKVEDFHGHNFDAMLEAELSRNLKKPPVVEYQIPTKVFNPEQKMGEINTLNIWVYP